MSEDVTDSYYPVPPPRRWPATVFAGLGLGLALFLFLIQAYGLPCYGTGCGVVLNSRYALLFGVPISLYAAICWCALIGPAPMRSLATVLLVVGSLFYLGLQRFILHSYCPWCVIHALVAGGSIGLVRRPPPHLAGMLVLAGAVAVGGYFWAREAAPEPGRPRLAAASPGAFQAVAPSFNWLTRGRGERLLVLDLSGPKSLELLRSLGEADWTQTPRGPRLVFCATGADRLELTVAFVAAVETRGGDPEAFRTVVAQVLEQAELWRNDPHGAARMLYERFPASETVREALGKLVRRQQGALATAGLTTAPLLLARGVSDPREFRAADLWSAPGAEPAHAAEAVNGGTMDAAPTQ